MNFVALVFNAMKGTKNKNSNEGYVVLQENISKMQDFVGAAFS